MNQFHNIDRPSGVLVSYGGKAKLKRCVLRCFLKVATEMSEQTDSGRLFQRDGEQECKALAPELVLTLETTGHWLIKSDHKTGQKDWSLGQS